MLVRIPTGSWIPAYVPQSAFLISCLLLLCAAVESATGGFDGSLLNGLNILPVYKDYFQLTPTTTGLNTASVFIGKAIALPAAGIMSDRLGRRVTIFWSSVLSIVGIIIQASAQNIGMFVAGRAILGAGACWGAVAAAVFLTETFSAKWRSWGVGILNNFYYIGALLAAGVTLGTSQWQSTWAWRAPAAFQAVFAVICIIILPFVPESPRWLVAQGLHDEALTVLAHVNAGGDRHHPIVVTQFKEIVDTLTHEKVVAGQAMSPRELIRTPVARRRLLVGASPGLFSCIAGNVIASYFFGAQLTQAGITNSVDQLKANVVLNAWCFVCCMFGTQLAVRWGRKSTALTCQLALTTFLFLIGGLTKLYTENPKSASQALIYGNVACIYLFQGAYSLAWTPLMTIYPPEVFNYSIRSNGYVVKQYSNAIPAIVLTYVMPIGLANIGWRMYIINASWDVVTFFLILFFWVETKGKSLEEIDSLFEGKKHSDAPDLQDVIDGKVEVDVLALEKSVGAGTSVNTYEVKA